MLKLKYLINNMDLAGKLLENWSSTAGSLHFIRSSANAIYSFQNGESGRILRFAPAAEKKREDILAELEFVRYLCAHGFPAAKTVLSESGEELVMQQTPWGAYHAAVFERARGGCFGDAGYPEELVFLLGRTMGRLHRLSSLYQPQHRRWAYDDVLEWCKMSVGQCGGQEAALKEAELLQKFFAGMKKSKETFGLVHYDFESDNVLYDAAEQTLTVIDFDDCMYHWFAMDIELTLRSLQADLDGPCFGAARAQFIEGYRTEFSIADDLLGMGPAFRRFADLYGYARVIRVLSEQSDDEPEDFIALRAKLARYLETRSRSFGDVLLVRRGHPNPSLPQL